MTVVLFRRAHSPLWYPVNDPSPAPRYSTYFERSPIHLQPNKYDLNAPSPLREEHSVQPSYARRYDLDVVSAVVASSTKSRTAVKFRHTGTTTVVTVVVAHATLPTSTTRVRDTDI